MRGRDVKTIAGGFGAPESARWFDGALSFVDHEQRTVNRLTDDGVEEMAGFARPMSIGFRPDGDLLVADIDTTMATSTLHVYRQGHRVDSIDLSAFGAANDMTVDRHGRAYIDVFRPPPRDDADAMRRWEPVGQVLLVPVDGEPRVVAEDIMAANGIGISPDGRTLVVGETWRPDGTFADTRLFGFDVSPDGSLSNRRVVTTVADGCCDGLCFDAEGAVWLSTASGGEVLRVLDGIVVDRIRVPDEKWPLACALGGPGMTTLYICAVTPPPRANIEVFPSGWDLTAIRQGFVEAVEVDVPGVQQGRNGSEM
jgi:sugar lactone lactonase YvrE